MGIALSVMVLITVMSVNNGFVTEIQGKIFRLTPHLTLTPGPTHFFDWKDWEKRLELDPEVIAVAPYIDGQGMVMAHGRMQGVWVRGIQPEVTEQVLPLTETLMVGNWADLKPRTFNVVVGKNLAANLGLMLGDSLDLVVPEEGSGRTAVSPRMKRFTVVGVFESGYVYDDSQIYVSLSDAATLYRFQSAVSGIQIRASGGPFALQQVTKRLRAEVGHDALFVVPWSQQHAAYFEAARMEKTMMTFVLSLIVALAAFNLVSMLIMLVKEKEVDIAVLRSQGMPRAAVVRIFMMQGVFVGGLGTVLGVLMGWQLSLHVTEFASCIERWLHIELFSGDFYFVDHLPSDFHAMDAWGVALFSLLLSFLATLYPAFRAARAQPSEVLRYA